MIKMITQYDFNTLIADAQKSARQRSHYNVHKASDDLVQKLFVAATPDSYFRPHRHASNSEFAVVLRGQFDIILFDNESSIIQSQRVGIGAETLAFEIHPNVWHCWLALTEEAIFFEAKQGPYIAETAAEFAPWAPEEGSSGVMPYMKKLRGYIAA